MTTWARESATTISDYMRDAEQAVLRTNKLVALAESHGNVTFGHSGSDFKWQVLYRLANINANSGETGRVFSRQQQWQQLTLPWRHYDATDAIYEPEYLNNRGEQALVKVFNGMGQRLATSMRQYLNREGYVDGNATGNEFRWHGFESFLAATQTITQDTNGAVAQAASTADKYAYPSDTYAGKSTALGNVSGSYLSSGNISWPAGECTTDFDYNTPIIANTTSSAWSNTTGNTWLADCDEILGEVLVHMNRNDLEGGPVDTCLLERVMYSQFKLKHRGKEKIETKQKGLASLGFGDVMNFDGIEVTSDYSIPANTGYGFSAGNIFIRSQLHKLVRTTGPWQDPDENAWKAAADHYGNMAFYTLRGVFKLYPFG